MGQDKLDFNAVAHSKFPPHGGTEICGVGEISVAHSQGPFNVEGVLATNRIRMEYLKGFPITKPRCLLVIWKNSVLASLDAVEAHRVGLHEAFGDGKPKLRAVAWVADGEVEGFDWMGKTFVACFEDVGIPLRLFRSLSQAQQWLRECLATQDPP